MQPTSSAQYEDAIADRVPAPDEVRPGIWSIPLPMAQPGNPFSICYLIQGDDGSLHLIDSGYDTEQNRQLFSEALARFGFVPAQLETAFVTHLHPDHLGLTARLRMEGGARIGMLRREHEAVLAIEAAGTEVFRERIAQWGVPEDRLPELRGPLGPDLVARGIPASNLRFEAGDLLPVPGRSLEVIATPGHTAGSACVVDREAGLLFTGDTVLPRIFPGLGLGDLSECNPIADYLDSLESLAEFDELEVAPGHNFRFRGLADRRAELAEHHLSRSRAAAEQRDRHPGASVWEVASGLRWTVGWQNLRSFYLFSALWQTELHLRFVESDRYPG